MRLHVVVTHMQVDPPIVGEMTFEVHRHGDNFDVIPGVFWSSGVAVWPSDVMEPLVSLLARQAAIFVAVPGRNVFVSSGIESTWHKL